MKLSNISSLAGKWISRVALMLLFGSAGSAYAGGWSAWLTIKTVYPASNGYIYVTFEESASNPDGCSSNAYYTVNQSGNSAASEIYALALAAATANKKIRFYLDGCASGTYPIVLHGEMDAGS